jgi:hypothetical protein
MTAAMGYCSAGCQAYGAVHLRPCVCVCVCVCVYVCVCVCLLTDVSGQPVFLIVKSQDAQATNQPTARNMQDERRSQI